MSKLPVIEKTLIEHLESAFPDTIPNEGDTDRMIWMKVGAVNVVRHLRSIYEDQQEDILNTD